MKLGYNFGVLITCIFITCILHISNKMFVKFLIRKFQPLLLDGSPNIFSPGSAPTIPTYPDHHPRTQSQCENPWFIVSFDIKKAWLYPTHIAGCWFWKWELGKKETGFEWDRGFGALMCTPFSASFPFKCLFLYVLMGLVEVAEIFRWKRWAYLRIRLRTL